MDSEDTVETVGTVEVHESVTQSSWLQPWNWGKTSQVTRTLAKTVRSEPPKEVRKQYQTRSRVRALQQGTNVLTGAQPVVPPTVPMRATSPVGRVALEVPSPVKTGGLESQEGGGTMFPNVTVRTPVSQGVQSPVVEVNVVGPCLPPKEPTRRDQRLGLVKEGDSTMVEATNPPAEMEWDDMGQAQDDEGQVAPDASSDSSTDEEGANQYRDAQEEVRDGETHDLGNQSVEGSLGGYYGYALWKEQQPKLYTMAEDGETLFFNVYEWRDVAILMTKELHGELLSKKWRELVERGNAPKVLQSDIVNEAVEKELALVRPEVQAIISQAEKGERGGQENGRSRSCTC
jgi:hypothetical protein